MLLQNDKNYKLYAKIWIRCFNRIKNFYLLFPFISNGLISLDFFSGAKNDIILALNLDKSIYPCTPKGIEILLDFYNIDTKHKKLL